MAGMLTDARPVHSLLLVDTRRAFTFFVLTHPGFANVVEEEKPMKKVIVFWLFLLLVAEEPVWKNWTVT